VDYACASCSVETVTIIVTGVNDAPTASNDSKTTAENTTLSSSVPVATDVDGTIASYVLDTTVSAGSLTFNANGTYTFNPGTAFDSLAAGASQDVSVTYHAVDNRSDERRVGTETRASRAANDATTTSNDAKKADENTRLSSSVPVACDVYRPIASCVLDTTVSAGSLTFNANGTYTFNPGTAFDSLAAGASQDVSVTYHAVDNAGASSSVKTVTITVTGVNDAPTASNDAKTTAENTTLSSSVPVATDVDGTIA